jgi:hypothetical protein
MPSIITGIIGGVQGASAAHNAANAQVNGYNQSAADLWKQVAAANPILANNANYWGDAVKSTASSGATGLNNAMWGGNQQLAPFTSNGWTASNNLSNLTGAGFNFNPSMSTLESTPGYQFALQEGQKAIDSSMSARGLGDSGAALKAGANYAEGLASTTYQNAFNNALSTYNSNVNSLLPQANMGLTASNLVAGNLMNAARYSGDINMAGTQYAGNAQISAGNNIANNLTNFGVYQGNGAANSGAAIANGDLNAANAWNGTLSGIGNGLTSLAMAGFGPGGGWSFGNMGTNLGGMWRGGGSNGPNYTQGGSMGQII